MAKPKTIDIFNAIVGLVGCVTGVFALTWQTVDAWRDRNDMIVIQDEFVPDRTTNRMVVQAIVTNTCKHDVYLREVTLTSSHRHGLEWPFPAVLNAKDETAALPSGAYRVYATQPISFDAIDEWRTEPSRASLHLEITTSRNGAFTSRDISGGMEIFLALAKSGAR
jgi:hypothetical protein